MNSLASSHTTGPATVLTTSQSQPSEWTRFPDTEEDPTDSLFPRVATRAGGGAGPTSTKGSAAASATADRKAAQKAGRKGAESVDEIHAVGVGSGTESLIAGSVAWNASLYSGNATRLGETTDNLGNLLGTHADQFSDMERAQHEAALSSFDKQTGPNKRYDRDAIEAAKGQLGHHWTDTSSTGSAVRHSAGLLAIGAGTVAAAFPLLG